MFLFGAGSLICTPTFDADGNTIATPSPVRLGTLQEVSGDISFETKKLYGSKQFPVAVGRGKGSISFTAKTAEIDGFVLGSLAFGRSSSTGTKAAQIDEAYSVPAASPYTVTPTPPSGGTISANLGVFNATTGTQMKRITGTPANAAEYSYNSSTNTYTFQSAAAGNQVLISYEYSLTTGQLFTISNDLMGLSPFFSVVLLEKYQGKNVCLKLNRATSGKLSLPFKNDDFMVSDFSLDAMADDSGIVGYISLF